MAVYRYDPEQDRMVDKRTGEPMVSGPFRPVVPMIESDIEPYLSPVSGEYVSGKRAKRDDLARHNCIDGSDMSSPTGGKFRSKKFAAKRGLTHLLKEEVND